MNRESAMPQVIEINHVDQLEDLRLVWNVLLQETRNASFFQTLDWLQAFMRHDGAGQPLRVLVVLSGGKTIGILPLTVVREKTRVGHIHVLTYPLHDWGTFYGPIGPNPTATLTLAMQHLQQTDRDWDMLDLRWIDRDGHDHLRTRWAMEHAGFAVRERAWKRTAMIDFDETWEEYWAGRDAKFRHNVSREGRRVNELGNVQYHRYRPAGTSRGEGDPRWDLYDACVQVARRSWQGSSSTGTTLCHENVAGFFRETHALAAKNGMLDLNLLTIDDQPVAYSYNYHCQGRLEGIRIGYDPAFSKYGVGNVLWHRTLQDCFARGDRRFDMGIGSLDYKKRWASRLAMSYHYTHYPLVAPRVQLLRLKHWTDTRFHLGEMPVSTKI